MVTSNVIEVRSSILGRIIFIHVSTSIISDYNSISFSILNTIKFIAPTWLPITSLINIRSYSIWTLTGWYTILSFRLVKCSFPTCTFRRYREGFNVVKSLKYKAYISNSLVTISKRKSPKLSYTISYSVIFLLGINDTIVGSPFTFNLL